MTAAHIGFDAAALAPPHSPGVARVAREILRALEARGNLDVVRLTPPAGMGLRAWRQRELPRLVTSESLVGLHSFTSAFPWRGPGKRVQTVHELPWHHGVKEHSDWRHRLWSWAGPLRADRVLCPSAFVAEDWKRRRLFGTDRLRVVPWGVAPEFTQDPDPTLVDELVLERYHLGDERFALALGAVRKKKNLAATLHGLAALREHGREIPRLVISGGDTPDLRRDLGLASKLGLSRWIVTLDVIEEEDLPSLLRLAEFAVVLSRSEGFGLPALEAVACGTPAVVARASAQAQAAGPAGITVDPADPQSVADGFARALDERRALAQASRDHANAHTWDRTAEAIEAVWGELA